MSEVTRILERAQAGDPTVADQLLPLVYNELRRIAAAKMNREAPGQTLQPTALVHEAWLRLGGEAQPNWQNRGHFSPLLARRCVASWSKTPGASLA